jgi:hypothetical protein
VKFAVPGEYSKSWRRRRRSTEEQEGNTKGKMKRGRKVRENGVERREDTENFHTSVQHPVVCVTEVTIKDIALLVNIVYYSKVFRPRKTNSL